MARPWGLVPTLSVPSTVLLLMLSTVTVPPAWVTYALLPSGVRARPTGLAATGMVMTTLFVAVSISDTEPEPALATYALDPSGVIATPSGREPTVIVALTVAVLVVVSI